MPNWKKLIVSGSDAALNSLNITSALTASGLIYPTEDGDNGDFLLTDGAGNLSFSRSTVFANVKNVSGVTLQKGTPVHATGTAGNASEVIAASASVASTMPATYVLNETLADDAEGLALITGYINGVDTSAFGEGDIIYVGASGGYTNVKPQGSGNLVQNLGIVNKVDASNGSGYVYGAGRSNDIPNLPVGKIWVGSSTYSVTSSIVTLDEDNSQAQITGSLTVTTSITGSSLQLTNLPSQASEATSLMIGANGNVGTRELGSNAFNSTAFTTCTGTVTGVTSGNTNTITIGGTSTAPTVAANTATIANGGTNLATGDQIYDHVTTRISGLTSCTGTVDTSGTPVDNDFAKFTDANTIEGRSASEMRSDLNVADGATACTGTVTSVTAGAGMTQTGTSTINPTLNVIGGTAITVNANNIEVTSACNTAWNAKTTCTGTVTGTGVNNRVATWSGTTSLDSNSAFTYDGTTLNVGPKATIGTNNSNTGTLSTIAGGTLNTASGTCSFIGGGRLNEINNNVSFIGSGINNCINSVSGYYGYVIAGGQNNTISGYGSYSTIVGGCNNTLSDAYCGFIGGGSGNTLQSSQVGQVIVGGENNTAGGACSGILGGKCNIVNNSDSFIIGSNLTSTANCYTFMNNACIAGTTRTQTLVETSARKYKECILPLQDQIKNIKKLEPVEFQWKKDKTKDIGFIAEEVKEIFPDLVAYEEDGEISGVQYSKLTTVLVKALQQQQEQIEELKTEIFIIKNNLDG